MKAKNFLIGMMVVSAGLGFVACSNDDDTPTGNPVDNINEVFPNGLVSSITRETSWSGTEKFISDIIRDKDGRVTSMKYRGDLYQISYPTSTTVKVTTIDEYDDYDTPVPYVRTFSLGKNGFISDFTEREGSDVFSFHLDYDNDGRITSRTDSYSGNYGHGTSKIKITYNDAGDIVRVDMESESVDDGREEKSSSVISVEYTNSIITKPIENKGGIMFYDEWFDIDFDEDLCLYYAGLLGKATAHLPLSIRQVEEYVYAGEKDSYDSTTDMNWTVNSNGLASSVTIVDEYETIKFSFNW